MDAQTLCLLIDEIFKVSATAFVNWKHSNTICSNFQSAVGDNSDAHNVFTYESTQALVLFTSTSHSAKSFELYQRLERIPERSLNSKNLALRWMEKQSSATPDACRTHARPGPRSLPDGYPSRKTVPTWYSKWVSLCFIRLRNGSRKSRIQAKVLFEEVIWWRVRVRN